MKEIKKETKEKKICCHELLSMMNIFTWFSLKKLKIVKIIDKR